MSYSNLFFIVYRSGRCGEFFGNLLSQHAGVYRPIIEYDRQINKYRTHDVLPRLLHGDFNLSDEEISLLNELLNVSKLVFRVHRFTDYQSVFPGCKIIVLDSKKHSGFFSNLFSAKYERYKRPPKSVFEKFNASNQQDKFEYTKDYFYLDLDDIFFYKNEKVYMDLCDFVGVDPIENGWDQILDYHQKNIKLVESLGLDPYETNTSQEDEIKNYLKIIATADQVTDYNYEQIT